MDKNNTKRLRRFQKYLSATKARLYSEMAIYWLCLLCGFTLNKYLSFTCNQGITFKAVICWIGGNTLSTFSYAPSSRTNHWFERSSLPLSEEEASCKHNQFKNLSMTPTWTVFVYMQHFILFFSIMVTVWAVDGSYCSRLFLYHSTKFRYLVTREK